MLFYSKFFFFNNLFLFYINVIIIFILKYKIIKQFVYLNFNFYKLFNIKKKNFSLENIFNDLFK